MNKKSIKVYIDITCLLRVNYVTGIQRVVREVVLQMLSHQRLKLVLLKACGGIGQYTRVDNDAFVCRYAGNGDSSVDPDTGKRVRLERMTPEDVFFDLDSVWNLSVKRNVLYPILKERGVKLAVYIYDIIPVTHPQYCHEETVLNFMGYIGAALQYANLLIASAQSTLDSIARLERKLGLQEVPGCVSWLGCDKKAVKGSAPVIDHRAVRAVSSGPYILTVGTIEPRKNHKVLLDAFDKGLFGDDLRLVFVGRIGWNVKELEKRIRQHPEFGRRLFLLEGMNDDSVDYLYRHALFVAFPTFEEGFGLPMIEAFERKAPVIASDIRVLREVGEDFALYFPPEDADAFIRIVRSYRNDPDAWRRLKSHLDDYEPYTWDQTARNIEDALLTVQADLE